MPSHSQVSRRLRVCSSPFEFVEVDLAAEFRLFLPFVAFPVEDRGVLFLILERISHAHLFKPKGWVRVALPVFQNSAQ